MSTNAILLKNQAGTYLLPFSKANLIELANSSKTAYFDGASNVQKALEYIRNSYVPTYVTDAINALDSVGAGEATTYAQYVSYVWQEDGILHAESATLDAAHVAYTGGESGVVATVQDELDKLEADIAALDDASYLQLKKVGTSGEEDATTVTADGTMYKLYQGERVAAQFNIEKDSFVKSGTTRKATAEDVKAAGPNPGFSVGDWIIVLVINTHDAKSGAQAEETIYIPAEGLVDGYTGVDTPTIDITVDTTNNTISAAVVEGSIGWSYLSSDMHTVLNNNVVSVVDGASRGQFEVTTYGGTTTYIGTALADVAEYGTASYVGVSVAAGSELAKLADGADVSDAQKALEQIAYTVNEIHDGFVTSVTGDSYTNDGVTITINPDTASTGDVVLELTHDLGNVALLHYDESAVAVEDITIFG